MARKDPPRRAKGSSANGFKVPYFKVPSFQVPDRTARLTFEGTAWEGAEVIVRLGISIELYLEVQRLVGENVPLLLTQLFGDRMLVAWNLVDGDGVPISVTGEGMARLPDIPFALRIVTLWLDAVAGVPAPLELPSGDGSTLAAASTVLDGR